MMTTKNTTKNFWSIDQEFFSIKIVIQSLFLFVSMICLSCNNNRSFALDTIKVENGWGYTIKQDNKIIIKQSVIPVITNNHSFKSENDAKKVGNLVMHRLQQNSSPTVTQDDLNTLAIQF